MVSVIVCGGGVIGLASALLLARDGHDVLLLEQDEASAPENAAEAWEQWERKGVPQFRQPHNLFPRFQQILVAELPDVGDRLLALGCTWFDLLGSQPPGLDPTERPGDDRFRYLTGRRPVVELAFSQAADTQQRLTVRRGVRLTGLLTGPSATPGVPHVAGVRTADGEQLRADLVIDAMGCRTPTNDWLQECGARPPYTSSQDCGFTYYTRYFRGPELPMRVGPPGFPMGSISLLTIAGDNDTWSVTLCAASSDRPMKALRDKDIFASVVDSCPLHKQWLEGDPISDVLPMAGVLDRYRRFVVDGAPVVTGLLAVGDAWACTNPSAGRGLSVGMIHAQALRDTVRAHGAEPAELAVAWDEATEQLVTPWFRTQERADRVRLEEMAADIEGRPAPVDPIGSRLLAAAYQDPELFRAMVEMNTCLALPSEVLAQPWVQERIEALGDAPVRRLPAPSRTRLLRLAGV